MLSYGPAASIANQRAVAAKSLQPRAPDPSGEALRRRQRSCRRQRSQGLWPAHPSCLRCCQTPFPRPAGEGPGMGAADDSATPVCGHARCFPVGRCTKAARDAPTQQCSVRSEGRSSTCRPFTTTRHGWKRSRLITFLQEPVLNHCRRRPGRRSRSLDRASARRRARSRVDRETPERLAPIEVPRRLRPLAVTRRRGR